MTNENLATLFCSRSTHDCYLMAGIPNTFAVYSVTINIHYEHNYIVNVTVSFFPLYLVQTPGHQREYHVVHIIMYRLRKIVDKGTYNISACTPTRTRTDARTRTLFFFLYTGAHANETHAHTRIATRICSSLVHGLSNPGIHVFKKKKTVAVFVTVADIYI